MEPKVILDPHRRSYERLAVIEMMSGAKKHLGRAVAPPGTMFIMGVSTSIKFNSPRYLRTKAKTFDLTMKVSLERSFIIKSKYRFLYLV